MTTGLNFWDIDIWMFVLILACIFLAMILANLLIKVIKPLRKALIPAPVLGGFLFLIIFTILKSIFPNSKLNDVNSVLEILTYHGLGLGFVATALKVQKKEEKEAVKGVQKDIFNASIITVSTYILQAIVGVAVSIGLYFVLNNWPASGLLIPMGYGQGPGQAFNWGNIFEQYTAADSQFGSFVGGRSFGLSIAAMGFVSASIGGLIYLNVQRKKGNPKMVKRVETHDEEPTVESFTEKNEIPASDSIDKASINIGIVFLVYAVSFLVILGISKLCDISGVKFLTNTIKPLFWGFNFIFGTGVAALFKLIMKKLYAKGAVKKIYTNNYMLDRISGTCFDVMVVAAIGAIDLSAFLIPSFIIPLVVMSIVAGVATYFFVKHVCNILYPTYKEEAFLVMYGMLTGTASTGIILLREIDPEYKTPATNDMIFQTLYAIVLGAPVLLAMGSAATSWKMLIIWTAVFIVLFIFYYLLMRRDGIISKIKAKKAAKNQQ